MSTNRWNRTYWLIEAGGTEWEYEHEEVARQCFESLVAMVIELPEDTARRYGLDRPTLTRVDVRTEETRVA